MSAAATAMRISKSRPFWLIGMVVAVLAGFFFSICVGVVHDASLQELHPADAIVVFGAAEYSGRPSPVYRARLDHAFDLFQRGIAPVIVTTGGAAADPKFSEGGVGHDYLKRRGVPDSSLIAETHGSDTAESAERVGVILRANHMNSCLAVSDEYHVFRIRRLLEDQGVRVYVEAALAGKAVVGSRSGGAAEAVLDGKTGLLVDPSSVCEVSGALLALLQDPVLAAKMGAEGCCWAQANFTIASMRKTLAELLAPYNGGSITEQGKRDSLRSPEPSRPNPEHLSDRWSAASAFDCFYRAR